MKNISKNLLLTPFISMLLVFAPVKADINVVTSIKPLHSLTSYIMEGVSEPDLIIDGVASPHNFQIKPSHAKMLQKADLVIWVGEDLESFLPTALKSIPKNSVVFPLLEQSGLKKLKFREKNIFEGHYSVPMTGAVLNTINIRLDAKTIAYILDHVCSKTKTI